MSHTNNIFSLELSTEDRLSKAKIHLNREFPFFAYIVEHLKFKEVDSLSTIGVDIKGNCYYNKKFIDELPNEQLMGVLCHEVQHPALQHFQRQKHRDVIVNNTSLWNVAIDIANNYLLLSNNLHLPAEGIIPTGETVTVFNTTIQNIGSKSAEELYDELLVGLEKNGKKVSSGNYETDEKIPSFDTHMEGDESGDEKTDDISNTEGEGNSKDVENIPDIDWNRVVAEAFNHAKMIGKTPAGFERYFEELHKPVVNWRTLLRKTVASFLPFDYTYRRPNKKYVAHDLYLPSMYGESIKVICSIDTSGSISQEDLETYMSEMIGIAKSFSNVEFRVLTHDTEVHDDVPIYNGHINKIKNLKIHGGGGTDNRPVFDYIHAKRYNRDTKVLICFTDGYTIWPEKPAQGLHTLCVLSGSHCPKESIPSWIKTICLN